MKYFNRKKIHRKTFRWKLTNEFNQPDNVKQPRLYPSSCKGLLTDLRLNLMIVQLHTVGLVEHVEKDNVEERNVEYSLRDVYDRMEYFHRRPSYKNVDLLADERAFLSVSNNRFPD